ncbi:PAS domain S-box protein [Colwellia sp. RSH04]|uniref:PAS domain S-box protein n=1 Tax=Colwellia sp. RSH04 TaxID=2305464 RepID=UPI0011C23C9B|nr:PAS domain S-box protein [Colwellia sp. RSH04]
MDLTNFRQLFEENIIPVARTNIVGEYIEANGAYEKLIGYSLAELKKLAYPDITPKKWHSIEINHVYKHVFANGQMSYEKEYIHSSGQVIPVWADVYLIKCENNTEAGMWGTFKKQ